MIFQSILILECENFVCVKIVLFLEMSFPISTKKFQGQKYRKHVWKWKCWEVFHTFEFCDFVTSSKWCGKLRNISQINFPNECLYIGKSLTSLFHFILLNLQEKNIPVKYLKCNYKRYIFFTFFLFFLRKINEIFIVSCEKLKNFICIYSRGLFRIFWNAFCRGISI